MNTFFASSGENLDWPFDAPPNVACHTVRAIPARVSPVLMVSRDEDDGAWHFLTGDVSTAADAMLVSLKSMVDLDSTLDQLADLQPGWMAWRQNPGPVWEQQAATSQTED